jgi:hypothetical protein
MKLGMIQNHDEIVHLDSRLLPVSYIIFDKNWQKTVLPMLEKLKNHEIYSIGRYGTWNYSSMGNDIHAANVVFKSKVDVWQIPRKVYRMMPVSHTELMDRVYPKGALGRYLTEQLIEFNNSNPSRPAEYRVLGDSPAIGVIMYGDCGAWSLRPAPEFDEKMNYIHTNKNRPIRVYENIDARFIMEDFYAKLSQFNQGQYENDIVIKTTPPKL